MWTIFTRPFSHWCEHHAVYESRSDVHTLILIQNCRHTRCAHRLFKYFYCTTLISITITLHIAASQPARNVIILYGWWQIYCNSEELPSDLNVNWWDQLGIIFVPKPLLLFPRTFNGKHKWYSVDISGSQLCTKLYKCFLTMFVESISVSFPRKIAFAMFINRFPFGTDCASIQLPTQLKPS